MKPIRCLLIDDEPLALEVLSAYVQKLDYLELAGVCNNAIDALISFARSHINPRSFLHRHTRSMHWKDMN